MLHRRTAYLPVVALALVTGCTGPADPGPQVTQEREVAGVTGVQLDTSGTLSVAAGDSTALTITAGRDVIDRLTSDVEDGILVLGTDGGISSIGDIRYTLVLPQMDSLTVNGSGNAVVESVPAEALAVAVNGSGSVELTGVAADELEVRLSGSGTVEAEGRATTQEVTVAGSGDYVATSLDSRRATVTVTGSGNADVRVTETLTAVVSGSGEIGHTGGARVTSTVDGSGDVVRR